MKNLHKVLFTVLTAFIIIISLNSLWLERIPVDVNFNIRGESKNVTVAVSIPSKKETVSDIDLTKNNTINVQLKKKGKLKKLTLAITDYSNLKKPILISNINVCGNKYKLSDLNNFKISNSDYKISDQNILIYPKDNAISEIEYPLNGYPNLKINFINFFAIIILSSLLSYCLVFFRKNIWTGFNLAANKIMQHNKFVSFLIAFLIYFKYFPKNLNQNNYIYAIGQMHLYDSSLFRGNVFLSDSISPRFFSDYLCVFLMKSLNISWETVQYLLLFIGLIILSYATVNIIFKITQNKQMLYTAILAFFTANNVINQIAGFSTCFCATTMMDVALSISILAISFSYKRGGGKEYNTAWLLLALAAFFHIHEAMYACLIVLLLFVLDCIDKKSIEIKNLYCLPVLIAAFSVIVIPNMMTDKMNISGNEFVQIYSIFRHPHHLMPSSWGMENIIMSFVFILFPGFLYIISTYLKNNKFEKRSIIEVFAFCLSWILIILGAYIFTEVYPVAFVSTMFFSKYFKYVGIIALIWYIKTIKNCIDIKKYILAMMVIYFAILIAITKNYTYNYLTVFSIVLLYILSLANFKIKNNVTSKILYYIRIFVPILIVIMLVKNCISMHKIFKNNKQLYIKDAGLCLLAEKFKNSTNKNDTFISDPQDGDIGWFQLKSERNCWVLSKIVPSSRSGISLWNNRYKMSKDLFEKDMDAIVKIMKDESIDYIIVPKKYYYKFDSSRQFKEYISILNDCQYKIYKYIR